jgi:hypothetical protein
VSLYETITIACAGCGKSVSVPAGPMRLAAREGKQRPVYCSRKCNFMHVAREGARLQDEQAKRFYESRDHRHDAGS